MAGGPGLKGMVARNWGAPGLAFETWESRDPAVVRIAERAA